VTSQVASKSPPFPQAAAYALRHWEALTRYLEDGFLDIDNNLAELTVVWEHIFLPKEANPC
jgi:hypothetical protein